METAFYPDVHFHHPADTTAQRNAKQANCEIVEISSDEDGDDIVDDGQPESSTRTTCVSPVNKRTVAIDNNDDSLDEEFEIYHYPFEPVRGKRQKLEHTDELEDMKLQINVDQLMDLTPTEHLQPMVRAPAPQYNTVDLSFTGVYNGDDRATLAFRPSVCPQGVNESFKKKRPRREKREHIPIEVEINKSKVRLETPPYYNDVKYEARMYCGPGFEKFSIVVGTVSEHQDICDEWDRVQAKVSNLRKQKQACRAELALYVNDTVDPDSSDEDEDETIESQRAAIELECLHKVREVLPDVQRKFALEQVRKHIETYVRNIAEDVQIQPSPSLVVNEILEITDYPKQEKRVEAKEPAADGTGVTVEWRKGDTESKTYSRDAVCLLAGQFDYVPTHFICKVVQDKKSLYESFFYLQDLETKYHTLGSKDRLYRRSHQPRVLLEKKYKAKGNDLRPRDQWENLVNEMQAARQQAERDRIRIAKDLEDQASEEANLQDHRASGNLVECQCCFDDEVPINRAVSCEDKEMHWFCFACILRLADDRIGTMKFEMSCMHQSGCKASLSKDGIRCVVPQKLLDKLAFYQQQYEITAACIEGLEQCPYCDFKAICDPIEETLVFQCQNPDCRRVTCRKCHEDSHLPKTCEEFKNDKRISARHQVEEARSEAMMRPCPKCKVKIIKEIGCNKMRCGRCGCLMCYVCKMDISTRKDGGYGHFNEAGAKCVLYDKDFDRHEAEANEAEREAIKRVQAENGDIDEKQLQIETGKQSENAAANPHRHGQHAQFEGFLPAPADAAFNFDALDQPLGGNVFEAQMRQHQALQRAANRGRRAEPPAAVVWPQRVEATRALSPIAQHLAGLPPMVDIREEVMEAHHRLHSTKHGQPGPTVAELVTAHNRRARELHRRRGVPDGRPLFNGIPQQDLMLAERGLPGLEHFLVDGQHQGFGHLIQGQNAMMPLPHHNPHGAQGIPLAGVPNTVNPMTLGNPHHQQLLNMQQQQQQVRESLVNNPAALGATFAPWNWNGVDINGVPRLNGNFGQHMNGWNPVVDMFQGPNFGLQAAGPQPAGQANASANMPAEAGLYNMRY